MAVVRNLRAPPQLLLHAAVEEAHGQQCLCFRQSNPSLRTMCQNGKELVLGENDTLPALDGISVPAGKIEIAPGSCTFIVL